MIQKDYYYYYWNQSDKQNKEKQKIQHEIKIDSF